MSYAINRNKGNGLDSMATKVFSIVVLEVLQVIWYTKDKNITHLSTERVRERERERERERGRRERERERERERGEKERERKRERDFNYEINRNKGNGLGSMATKVFSIVVLELLQVIWYTKDKNITHLSTEREREREREIER